MNDAAKRAAQALLGASRNRPSMSQGRTSSFGSGHGSSNSGGDNNVAEVSDESDNTSGYAEYSDRTSSGGGGSSDTGRGPSFMRDLQSQYESLSDRLAREVSMSAGTSTNRSPSSGNSSSSNNNNKGGGILKSSSARRVRWAETARIASTMDADRASAERNDDDLLDRSPMDVLADLFQRKYTLPIFLVVTTAIFLLVHLTSGPNNDTFARYDPNRSGVSVPSKAQELIPGENQQVIGGLFPGSMTRSGIMGESDIDNLSTFSLTPVALDLESLAPTMAVIHHTTPKISPLLGISPSLLRAQSGDVGSEEEDWIVIETESGKLGGEDSEDDEEEDDDELVLKSQTGLSWNYPPGVPTPNPALLVEISPPGSTNDADVTEKSQLGWGYPPGVPTPDPALLAGVPDSLTWGYPPGVPTPDPALLEDLGDETGLGWGYPDGVPTPDPALLMGGDDGDETSLGWGYPPGEPTPDPAYLNGPGISDSPTVRKSEFGEARTTPPPLTLKLQDMSSEFAQPPPPGPNGPKPPKGPPTPKGKRPPLLPVDYIDFNGNDVEIAHGEEEKSSSSYGKAGDVQPEVATVPYSGPGGFIQEVVDANPDWMVPGLGGPNGYNIGGGQNMVIPQMQNSCGCCCCNCGGGSVGGYAQRGMVLPLTAQGYEQHMNSNGQLVLRSILPGSMLSTSSSETLGCPWECLIDETVSTKGRSNEDDALYEIFYTNPLNCCGTIVEVGAGNGLRYSTSFFFEKGMNWTTHLIEADPQSYAKIGDNRSGKKVTATNGAFCKVGPYLYFDETSRTFQGVTSEDDLSSEVMSKDFTATNSTRTVDCVRLDTILAGIDHVNVLVIRVKGDPWAVIRTMDWNIKVDIWVILMEQKDGVTHDTTRSALKLHDYVPSAWDIKLWCDTPSNCMQNEVWLRKNFNPINKPLLQDHRGLRGGNEILLI